MRKLIALGIAFTAVLLTSCGGFGSTALHEAGGTGSF